ncbi:NADH:flavin oxidoreductase/NADH oxidase [Desulfitobacterium hafniense DCB-2]|uniref:NADH:flavin oxidoreductase/NADH oxidase n=1 Tax=Desulfitobacterium hafniense (strain DSM 10664 / DCB-2) TaxID=272564 RepID=B8FXK2_DESHD|nr:FAD-dependent oxidoreductase [Desulfitobacterium hafniense]ACL22603.1 NADH:flavin oxidoreductase/NADH oxidase [Desulfitobacterium hafniense DCB-2]
MMSEFTHLFKPIKVGSLTLRNRMITTSMSPGHGYTTDDNKPTQVFLNYLEERSKGGYALICQSVAFYPRQSRHPLPNAYAPEHLPHLRAMAEAVHKHGGLLVGQALALHDWRRNTNEPEGHFGPSDIQILKGVGPFQTMTKEDIKTYATQVANCGKILQAAGWDGIELLAGVGGVLSRFLSKATNNRTDEYGGSVENRCRFAMEVVQAVKEACGQEFPVLIRWSPVDYVKNGNEIEDAKQIVPYLEKAGVAWHNLAVGWHESSVPLTTKEIPDGHWSWIAAEIKKVATIPVVTGYRETDPLVMEKVLAEGKADLIGGVRYCIADPEFPNKVREGRLEDIQMCITCCRCLDEMAAGHGLEYCSVNPRLGPELLTPVEPVARPKKVMVVGSGPGGLAAALTAAKRGHQVTLYERGPRVGGCLVMSAIFSPTYERLTRYYKAQLSKTPNIQVKLNTLVTPELVRSEKPEAVIIAVGGHPVDLKAPGVERGDVVRSHDFLEMLNGKPPQKPGLINKVMWNGGAVFLRLFYSPKLVRSLMGMPWPFGKRVAIIGGGLPGCELGQELLAHQRKMAILEERKKIGYDVGASDRFHVVSKFKKSPDVQMEPSTKVLAITAEGVKFRREDSTEAIYPADTVAVTLGFEKNLELADRLKGKVPILKVIGDCEDPKRMADATKKGYRAAMEL